MCAVRKQAMGLGLLTHPPAPSQREGGTPFVWVQIGKATCRKKDFHEKDLPFPLGRGRGMGCVPHTHPSLARTLLQLKAAPLRFKTSNSNVSPSLNTGNFSRKSFSAANEHTTVRTCSCPSFKCAIYSPRGSMAAESPL
jgi:hypothetical protein